MSPDQFRALVRDAQAGDQPAIDRLFEHTAALVGRFVHFSPLPAGADESERDFVQKACLRVFTKLHQFQGARQAPDDEQAHRLYAAWVRQVARGVVRKDAQKKGRRDELAPQVPLDTTGGDDTSAGRRDPPSPEPTPSRAMRTDERSRLVLTALEQIPDPVSRQVIRLRFFEGQSLHQIAERLGLSYDVTRGHFAAAKSRLQRDLEGLR